MKGLKAPIRYPPTAAQETKPHRLFKSYLIQLSGNSLLANNAKATKVQDNKKNILYHLYSELTRETPLSKNNLSTLDLNT